MKPKDTLPLTNVEKFKKVKYSKLAPEFETPFEHKEYFYTQLFGSETVHGYYYYNFDEMEGIMIHWKGNPFDLHHNDENYLILTDKRKEWKI